MKTLRLRRGVECEDGGGEGRSGQVLNGFIFIWTCVFASICFIYFSERLSFGYSSNHIIWVEMLFRTLVNDIWQKMLHQTAYDVKLVKKIFFMKSGKMKNLKLNTWRGTLGCIRIQTLEPGVSPPKGISASVVRGAHPSRQDRETGCACGQRYVF